MIKVTSITTGKIVPSSRFRVRQFIEPLREENIFIKEFYSTIPYDFKLPYPLNKIRERYLFPITIPLYLLKIVDRIPEIVHSYHTDLTFLNRPMVPILVLERLLKKPLIFDVDDAIWLNDKKQIDRIAKCATAIIAGNNYIGSYFKALNKNVYVVPTAVDTDYYKQTSKDFKTNEFIIGWLGTSDNYKYLYKIENGLAKFLDSHKEARLMIISNKPPEFKQLNQYKFEFIKWSYKTEIEYLKKFTLGIMPLENSEWAKGKCSYKLLQYMSMGIPVIASPVGMNNEVLARGKFGFSAFTDEEWIEKLKIFYNDRDLCTSYGINARIVVEDFYSIKVLSKKLVHIITEINRVYK